MTTRTINRPTIDVPRWEVQRPPSVWRNWWRATVPAVSIYATFQHWDYEGRKIPPGTLIVAPQKYPTKEIAEQYASDAMRWLKDRGTASYWKYLGAFGRA